MWSDAENYTFRMHHEAIHVLSDAPAFDLGGEAATWIATCRDLGVPTTKRVGLILFGEIVGQAKYFEKTGVFPVGADGLQPAVTDPRQLFYLAKHYEIKNPGMIWDSRQAALRR